MTYKVLLNGEDLVSGKTPLDIVRELMKLEFLRPRPKTVRAFMQRVAKRSQMTHPDRRIRTGRTRDFLDDLVAAGLLKKVTK
jgi:hypothetical protein